MELQEALEKFEHAAKKHGEATEAGDYKCANKYYDVITNTINVLKESNSIRFIESLLSSTSPYVRLWSSTYFLLVDPEKSVYILNKLKQDGGIVSFTADNVLKEWFNKRLKL